eukprot:gene15520-biopygen3691
MRRSLVYDGAARLVMKHHNQAPAALQPCSRQRLACPTFRSRPPSRPRRRRCWRALLRRSPHHARPHRLKWGGDRRRCQAPAALGERWEGGGKVWESQHAPEFPNAETCWEDGGKTLGGCRSSSDGTWPRTTWHKVLMHGNEKR